MVWLASNAKPLRFCCATDAALCDENSTKHKPGRPSTMRTLKKKERKREREKERKREREKEEEEEEEAERKRKRKRKRKVGRRGQERSKREKKMRAGRKRLVNVKARGAPVVVVCARG